MMKCRIEMMTRDDYVAYMIHGYGYQKETIWIEAETKEEAYQIAEKKYPTMVIINDFIKTEEEIKDERKRRIEIAEEINRKEKEKADRKAKREEEKAQAMNITIEEYKEYKRAKTNRKRYETEIEKAKAKIKEIEKKIPYYEEKMKYYNDKVEKIENKGR